jgi:diguanylate cyclase (GGDEF)-like protein/putative nucleotidyltransferase with HDIG domain
MKIPLLGKLYILAVVLIGALLGATVLSHWQSANLIRLACYLALSLFAARLKATLPGITGSISVLFIFILFAIVELNLAEALVIGCVATLVQCCWKKLYQPSWQHVLFNVCSMAITVVITSHVYYSPLLRWGHLETPVKLVLAAVAFFALNTFPIAAAVAITERKSLRRVWKECYFWAFPYYLTGTLLVAVAAAIDHFVGWQTALLAAPAAYLIYRAYFGYTARLEDQKKHAEETAALHLRTIEALALAIEAKDQARSDHFHRVETYAAEIGRELGLGQDQLAGLRAAALLHDIGKLAVPEHIVSKPGKLTREEFEKMKIHPVVGAEILERVRFPYEVTPIVRSHHERWDGSGYPDGLKGENIPIGARILAAVDFVDALASERQYRRAIPLEEAIQKMAAESGKGFDPRIAEILQRRYLELESLAKSNQSDAASSIETVGGRHQDASSNPADTAAPASAQPDKPADFLASIAAARQEVQNLFELTQDLGNSLSLNDTMSLLAIRLKRMIPYDALAVYVLRNDKLRAEYVTGENFSLFSSLEIPLGQGLSGWVAEHRKPVMNGNPAAEPGYLDDETKFTTMNSALAVPLIGLNGTISVLTLYRSEREAFTNDHLRILLAVCHKIALSIENALKFEQAQSTASTDYMTNLPNARSLFLHLDSELARCRRLSSSLTVLVCDMNGFKQVNDKFGHLEGNRLLSCVAEKLKESCREYDYVARMGGDEFVLVLPGLEREQIPQKIQRLQAITAEAGQMIAGNDTALGLSVGHAIFPEDGVDADRLLSEADRRMYLAKQKHKLKMVPRGFEFEPTGAW